MCGRDICNLGNISGSGPKFNINNDLCINGNLTLNGILPTIFNGDIDMTKGNIANVLSISAAPICNLELSADPTFKIKITGGNGVDMCGRDLCNVENISSLSANVTFPGDVIFNGNTTNNGDIDMMCNDINNIATIRANLFLGKNSPFYVGDIMNMIQGGIADVAIDLGDRQIINGNAISSDRYNLALFADDLNGNSGDIMTYDGTTWCPLVPGALSNVITSITGGTGISTVPLGNDVTINNDGVLSVTSGGTGITIGGTAANPTVTNDGVLAVAAGTGMSVTGPAQNPTVNNTGVLSVAAGTGAVTVTGTASAPIINNTGVASVTGSSYIGIAGTATNPIVNNTGVTRLLAGAGITVNGGAGPEIGDVTIVSTVAARATMTQTSFDPQWDVFYMSMASGGGYPEETVPAGSGRVVTVSLIEDPTGAPSAGVAVVGVTENPYFVIGSSITSGGPPRCWRTGPHVELPTASSRAGSEMSLINAGVNDTRGKIRAPHIDSAFIADPGICTHIYCFLGLRQSEPYNLKNCLIISFGDPITPDGNGMDLSTGSSGWAPITFSYPYLY
jgi:hypothetical protein